MSDETKPDVKVREEYEYGSLWCDGTFAKLSWMGEGACRKEFADNAYTLKGVPDSLRPVFARRRIVTSTATYAAEAWETAA